MTLTASRTGLPFVLEKPDRVQALARAGRKRGVSVPSYIQEDNLCLQEKCTAGAQHPCWDLGHRAVSAAAGGHDVGKK